MIQLLVHVLSGLNPCTGVRRLYLENICPFIFLEAGSYENINYQLRKINVTACLKWQYSFLPL